MGRISPQDIREHEFKQSALGYSREQVNQFLDEVAEELETLIREANEIHGQNKEVKLALATYKNVEESLKETLVLAQNTAQETLSSAQNEADNVLRKANTEKDALLFSAKEDLSAVQVEIKSLLAKRDSILIKLRGLLQTNMELLDVEFSDNADVSELTAETEELKAERIVDFSKADLVIEDLPSDDEEPEIIFDNTEDFEDK